MWRKLKIPAMLVLLVVLAVTYYADKKDVNLLDFFDPVNTTLRIGSVPMSLVGVADTYNSRLKGLSGRKGLKSTEGLLFIFDKSDFHKFWMKDMLFPIDIIWVDEDFKVVSVTRSVLPESYPKIFEPPRPVRYVIETDIYFTEAFGIKEGDIVTIPDEYLQQDL